MAKAKERLALLVREIREYGYFHIRARVVRLTEERGNRDACGWKVDNFCDWEPKIGCYADLEVNSQGNDEDGDRRRLYGFDVRYRDVYSLDLYRAEKMVKTLRKVDRSLRKQRDEGGETRNVAVYIGRVARAIGAKHIVFEKDKAATGYRYDVKPLGDGIDGIHWLAEEWIKEGKEESVN